MNGHSFPANPFESQPTSHMSYSEGSAEDIFSKFILKEFCSRISSGLANKGFMISATDLYDMLGSKKIPGMNSSLPGTPLSSNHVSVTQNGSSSDKKKKEHEYLDQPKSGCCVHKITRSVHKGKYCGAKVFENYDYCKSHLKSKDEVKSSSHVTKEEDRFGKEKIGILSYEFNGKKYHYDKHGYYGNISTDGSQSFIVIGLCELSNINGKIIPLFDSEGAIKYRKLSSEEYNDANALGYTVPYGAKMETAINIKKEEVDTPKTTDFDINAIKNAIGS